jgi:MFS family permease
VTQDPAPSYRALLAVPTLPRILLSMALARIAGAMVSIAIILFTLSHYQSPELAGLVTFVSIVPGLLVSPIAGALLDRHGRTRLVVFDYLVGAASLVLIGALALADDLPAWLLVAISAASSLTSPLSNTGLRSLFPIIVPPPLWTRVNAIDSNGYLASTLIGPPIAAAMVQFIGGPVTLMIVGVVFAVAAVILVGTTDPTTGPTSGRSLLRESWEGLRYTWSNRTIRGLAFSMSTLNLSGGVMTIVLPIIVLDRLHESEAFVGAAWAIAGLCGMLTGLWFGRLDSHGREKGWLVWSMLGSGVAFAILLANLSIPALLLAMAVTGLLNGPLDIALFTIRQRRTDPAWLGRAIAVSASLNFSGYPFGSALTGVLVDRSLDLAILLGVVACVAAAFLAWWQIPGHRDAMRESATSGTLADG